MLLIIDKDITMERDPFGKPEKLYNKETGDVFFRAMYSLKDGNMIFYEDCQGNFYDRSFMDMQSPYVIKRGMWDFYSHSENVGVTKLKSDEIYLTILKNNKELVDKINQGKFRTNYVYYNGFIYQMSTTFQDKDPYRIGIFLDKHKNLFVDIK